MSAEFPAHVLLVARDMMGDLVNTTGAVLALRQAFPETSFTLEGGAAASELFQGPYDGLPLRVWTRPRHAGLWGRIRRVRRWRAGRFGVCIVLEDGHSHARLARLAGISRIYGAHRGKPELFTASVAFDVAGHDLFGSLAGILALVGARNPDLTPRLFPSEQDVAAGERLFDELGQPRLLLHVGASDPKKNWPDERWHELVGLLQGVPAAAVAGLGENPERFGLPSLVVAPTLLEYAALLTRVEHLITPDTGPAHLAAAMGTPTTVLYGPTDPVRFHPWDNRNQILIREEAACSHYGEGCGFAFGGECPRTCMLAIRAEDVFGSLPESAR